MPTPIEQFLAEFPNLPDFVGITPIGIHTRGHFGDTPLHVAAARGDLTIIKALIESGAEIDAQGEHGFTPLHEAIQQGHIEAARLLISLGANRQVRNDAGDSAIDIARIIENTTIEQLLTTAPAV